MSDPASVHRPARLGRRAGAYLIDAAIGLIVLLIAVGVFAGISFGTGGGLPLSVAVLLAYVVGLGWLVVYTVLQAGAGSLGMRALGLRLVREGASDAAPLGFGRALGRNLVWGLGAAIVVGYFSPLFDGTPWRRGWHDRAAGAVMTDVAGRPAVPSEDASVAPTPAAPVGALAPSVLPPAPILPAGDAADLDGWTPAGPAAPAPASPLASGVISFVPGVSDPSRLDEPAPAPAPAVPTVDAAPVGPPPARDTAAAPGPRTADVPLIENLDETRISTGERPFARLVWDDGTRQAVYGRTLFGRNPAPETGAMVSAVRDETLSLSKTHFELVPADDRSVWVVDRHSTNGVVLRRGVGGADAQPLVPGERTRVRSGDVLEFGDRQVTIEVAS
ncbi:RDD family protein [Microbacterium hominis]|uniref:RDD family protein n=1 Tax=Microbacterium TaxID=33882 RepID=UPI00168AD9D0|nr:MULTISPECIES: RDD family protein [Microbacterium]QOC26635.1 RDD family protein [Microbacterium hominis]QOC27808.1 RDD family protein [Microbacterium hominis]QYF97038.1 RDD family protein [Microbacterium sp. PAMC21962]